MGALLSLAFASCCLLIAGSLWRTSIKQGLARPNKGAEQLVLTGFAMLTICAWLGFFAPPEDALLAGMLLWGVLGASAVL